LLINLREAFAPHGLKLSVTIAPWQTITPEGVQAVDWVQLMAYDHAGPHSTFDHAKAAIATARQSGIPAAQLVLGLPFYGRDPSRRERTLAYREILARHAPGPDVNEADGLFFNGPGLIRNKTAFARQLGLAGVMVWELGQDAPPPHSLLQVIHDAAQGR
jgi:GH18 family chitinase